MDDYICDPARNESCSKALCFERGGPCGTTDRPEFAMRDIFGRPVKIIREDEHNDGQ